MEVSKEVTENLLHTRTDGEALTVYKEGFTFLISLWA